MTQLALLIPLLPLAGFVVMLTVGRRLGDPVAGWVATLAVAASFVVGVVTFAGLASQPIDHRSVVEPFYSWISVGGLGVHMGLLVDPLSMTMVLFVTGIASLIHMYSIGYMRGDRGYSRFFLYLNLFVFSMVVLVLADNMLLTFLGWEGVGVCSYWLVSFWFDRPSAASAGKKAFIYNRVGDVGFLLAMFVLFSKVGSLEYTKIFAAISQGRIGASTATLVGLLLFLGAAGKSAQLPLYPWLVDAMEGPTPVSALIHAATMVTAGVYLMVRFSPLLALTPTASAVIATVGVVTAFLAASAACAQTDIKKVLAYSTVSQLGYMFLAVGARAYVAAIFLMVAHAFYKALLFLGAGSVIHGMHDEQDIKKMGGLRRYMPVTGITFIVAWLAIGGLPPLAGFWAKGDVLLNAWAYSPLLWGLGAVTAVLTAYYVGRETMLVFFGPERWRNTLPAGPGADHGAGTPHESPAVMTVPLAVLAVLAVLGGGMELPFPHTTFLADWLSPVLSGLRPLHLPNAMRLGLEGADGVFALMGIGAAVALWRKAKDRPALEPRFLFLGWGLNELFEAAIAKPGRALGDLAANSIDRGLIDGAVVGTARMVASAGQRLRLAQSGYVRNYALTITLGAVLLLGYVVTRTVL